MIVISACGTCGFSFSFTHSCCCLRCWNAFPFSSTGLLCCLLLGFWMTSILIFFFFLALSLFHYSCISHLFIQKMLFRKHLLCARMLDIEEMGAKKTVMISELMEFIVWEGEQVWADTFHKYRIINYGKCSEGKTWECMHGVLRKVSTRMF